MGCAWSGTEVQMGAFMPNRLPCPKAGASYCQSTVQFTCPNGLSFVYQDDMLYFVDRQLCTRHPLKNGVAPPMNGLRAQLVWATVITPEATAAKGTSSDNDTACTVNDLPESVLQLIAWQLLHDAAIRDYRGVITDDAVEAATAAAALACTGSKAALFIAHDVWALLEPDRVRPYMHVQKLRRAQVLEAQPASLGTSTKINSVSLEALAAAQALCVLADPLRCPLSAKLTRQLHRQHRMKVADRLLSNHDLTVDSLPVEYGIRAAMRKWIMTGCLDDRKQCGIAAVWSIAQQHHRFKELTTAAEQHDHRSAKISISDITASSRCREYVKFGAPDLRLRFGMQHACRHTY